MKACLLCEIECGTQWGLPLQLQAVGCYVVLYSVACCADGFFFVVLPGNAPSELAL